MLTVDFPCHLNSDQEPFRLCLKEEIVKVLEKTCRHLTGIGLIA